MSLTRAQRNYLDYQFADVTAAKAAAEDEKKREEEEKKKREEEERKRREEEEKWRQEEERRRYEEEKRQQTDDSRRVEESRQTRQPDEQRRNQQPQTIEEESALVRQKLEEQRRRQEEQRRLEEERRRQEEERRRREEEERRRREEEEKKKREEEERKRREEERRRQEEEKKQQLLTLEEETALIRERRQRAQAQQQQHTQQQTQVAPGVQGDGDKDRQGKDKQVDFDEVAKLLREEGDPRKVVEKLREMGYEVKEVSERGMYGTTHYGWVVKVGDRYIAITSGHRVGYGDVGDYAMMELPDESLAKNFLVGRYFRSEWGDPEFVKRTAEALMYEKQLDRWMREELGKLGYTVERIDWRPENAPEDAPVRGFTYIIRDKDGNKIGEVQVTNLGFKYGILNTGLPPTIMATGDPRVAAAYFVYKHITGDENIAWRLAIGDEWGKRLFESKTRYESEMEARERWFNELTQRGLKPIAYSQVDGKPVVSENDLFLDEKTGVTYRVVLERQGDKIAMKLVPSSERDERLLAVKSLEKEGFTVIDDSTVERDGVKYRVEVVDQDGKKVLRLVPEDPKKAAEREVWWELWRQGYVRRGEYAVKDGVKYKVVVEEQDGRYVAKLTPVGQASPEEEPRRYRRGDQRGSLESMKQVQFNIEKLGLEKEFSPDDLRFGVGGRPRAEDLPYFPGVDEVFYGAVGVPLSQALRPAGRELYWRYTTSTSPGPRVEGFTLPERQELERVAETQRIYAERFSDVWTPLTLRAPTERDVNWRTAVATGAEAFTFWIPVAKGAAALAATRGLKMPVLTTERTATSARGVKLPRVPGDYFEIHYVEPRRIDESIRGAFVGYGVGEGAAVRGGPGNWEAVFARAGEPAPGWAFEGVSVTYRDVADWLRRIPSIGIPAEVRPRTLRVTEVRGFARDIPKFETPRYEPPKYEPPRFEQPGREVKVADATEPPTRETPRAEPPRETETKVTETTRRSAKESLRRAEEGGSKQVALQEGVVKAEEELVKPVRAELPVAQHVKAQTTAVSTPKAEEEGRGVEQRRTASQAPAVTAFEVPVAERIEDERVREAEVPVAPLRELGLVPETWSRDFTAPIIQPFEIRTFETPTVSTATYETERTVETAGYDTWTTETPSSSVRTVETQRTTGTFPTPPPPTLPLYVRGGYGGGGGSAYVLHRPARLTRRGWRVYELLRI